ncbi:hypothetical protein R1sor_008659, partial [Riccia sorocarpa]
MAGSTGSFDTEAKKVGVQPPGGDGKLILATLRALTFVTSLTAFLLVVTNRQSVGTGASKAWAKWHYDGTF